MVLRSLTTRIQHVSSPLAASPTNLNAVILMHVITKSEEQIRRLVFILIPMRIAKAIALQILMMMVFVTSWTLVLEPTMPAVFAMDRAKSIHVVARISQMAIAIAMAIRMMSWVSVVAHAWPMQTRMVSAMMRTTAPTQQPVISMTQPTPPAISLMNAVYAVAQAFLLMTAIVMATRTMPWVSVVVHAWPI